MRVFGSTVGSALGEVADPGRAERMVAASRELVAHAGDLAAGPDHGGADGDPARVVDGLVTMLAALEASMNALAAQRCAILAVAAAVVDAAPGTMLPMPPDAVPSAADRELARAALVSDVAAATGASETTTATLVGTAGDLVTRLPGVLTAMASGVLGDRHVTRVVRHAEDLPSDACARYETDVLSRLDRRRTPAEIGRVARAARERCHPRTLTERHERASRDRSVYLDEAPDGMAWLHALLPAVQAGAIYDKLTGIARSLQHEPDETRTLAQLRADALTGLALDPPTWAVPECTDGSGPAGRDVIDRPPPERVRQSVADEEPVVAPIGPSAPGWLDPALLALRPTVAVTVPVLTLLGLGDEPGHLDGYGPVDPDTARVLAAHAPSFIRLLTHPETGAVLSVGRDRYAVPADLRTWLRLRDQTCRFPGCGRPAGRGEVDHTVPFREGGAGGETAAANLAFLCRRHHRFKHSTRWRVVQQRDGTLAWTSPTGRTHTTEPALRLDPSGPSLDPSGPRLDASGRRGGAPPIEDDDAPGDEGG